jgi:hypothetical protein
VECDKVSQHRAVLNEGRTPVRNRPAGGAQGAVHVTMLEYFFDEVKRQIPAGVK